MLSRYALDYVYPVPFILGWLLFLVIGLEPQRSRVWLVLAGLCLGDGLYSYIASLPLMPIYLAATLAALLAARRSRRDLAAVVSGFAVPLIVFLIWFAQHPEAFQGTADRYALRSLDVGAIAGRYFGFFNPDFLFLTGDTYLPFSTRTAGVFALASALLMAAGIYAVIVERHIIGLLVLSGFIVAPAAASILDDPGAIRRATGMLAFGAILAAFGARQLTTLSRIPGLRQAGMDCRRRRGGRGPGVPDVDRYHAGSRHTEGPASGRPRPDAARNGVVHEPRETRTAGSEHPDRR